MKDGLKDEHRRLIVDVLASQAAVEKAVLFGSRASGNHQPASDVDIALYGKSLTLDDLARLATTLEHLPIPQKVDLLLHERIENKSLLDHIERHGIVWFDRTTSKDTGSIGR